MVFDPLIDCIMKGKTIAVVLGHQHICRYFCGTVQFSYSALKGIKAFILTVCHQSVKGMCLSRSTVVVLMFVFISGIISVLYLMQIQRIRNVACELHGKLCIFIHVISRYF